MTCRPCPSLDEKVARWFKLAPSPLLVVEITRHWLDCPVCRVNREIIAAWHEAHREKHDREKS